MKTNPRRRHRRRRNPARVAAAVRSNPHRRRRHHRRNPARSIIVRANPHRSGRRKSHRYGVGKKALLNGPNMKIAGGALGSIFLVNFVNNYLMTNVLASTVSGMSLLTRSIMGAVIKAGVGYGAAYMIEKKSPELAQGVFLGSLIVAGSDVLNAALAGTSVAAPATSAYLGRNLGSMPFQLSNPRVPVSRKVGQYMQPGGNVRSMVGPVSPTANTFATNMRSVYGGTSAFKTDAWTRQ